MEKNHGSCINFSCTPYLIQGSSNRTVFGTKKNSSKGGVLYLVFSSYDAS